MNFKRIMLLLACAAGAANADVYKADDPFADAKVWIKGYEDTAGTGVLQADGIASAVGASAQPWTSATVRNNVVVSNEWVTMPYRGGKYLTKTLYLPQTVTITNAEANTGTGLISTFTLNNFNNTAAQITDDNFTVAFRFRPDDGDQFNTSYCWMVNCGYGGWSQGFNFGLSKYGSETTTFKDASGVSHTVVRRRYTPYFFKQGRVVADGDYYDQSQAGNPFEGMIGKIFADQWHDIVISFDNVNRKIRTLLVRAHWDPEVAPFDLTGVSDTATQNVFTNEVPMHEMFTYKPSPNLLVGAESGDAKPQAWPSDSTSGNAAKCFRGSIHHIAAWNRTMSFEEMKRVVASPRGDVVRVGVRDGSSNEFRGGETTDQESSQWTLPSSFASGDSATITFTPERKGEHEMGQLFRWYGAEDSAKGRICLEVNGHNVGTQSVAAAQTTRWKVEAGKLVVGENSLKITRTDTGAGAVKPDAFALGGSLQIGYKDSTFRDFAHEGKPPSGTHELLDGNFYTIRRILFACMPNEEGKSSAHTNQFYTFTFPREFNNRSLYSWSLGWKEVTGSSARHSPRWRLNGHDLDYTAPYNGGYHTIKIPNSYFTDGVNTLEFYNYGTYLTNSYLGLDYWRMEVETHESTLVIIR